VDTEPQTEEQHEEVAVMDPVENTDVPEESVESNDSEGDESRTVPLRAVQKERKRRQEAEAESYRQEVELKYLREQLTQPKQQEEDESEYESASRKELRDTASKTKEDVKRDLREEIWVESHSAQSQWVDENLSNFLKQRPHLSTAISQSPNRYKEAYELMTALSPKQQQQISSKPQKREAPNAPNSVPKAAGVNQAMDIMNLSDEEFSKWRSDQRRKR